MAIHWRLKTYLATKHGIYRTVALQKRVAQKTGILISIQNLCNLLEKKPKSIRLQTMELLCTALECELHDFCEISPSTSKQKVDPSQLKKLAHQNTPINKRAVKNFPDPRGYS